MISGEKVAFPCSLLTCIAAVILYNCPQALISNSSVIHLDISILMLPHCFVFYSWGIFILLRGRRTVQFAFHTYINKYIYVGRIKK